MADLIATRRHNARVSQCWCRGAAGQNGGGSRAQPQASSAIAACALPVSSESILLCHGGDRPVPTASVQPGPARGSGTQRSLFTLENHGAVVVDRAIVKVVTGDEKLVGFAENESSHPRLREWDFGRLSPGEPVSAEFVTLEKAAHDSRSEVFVIAFQRDKDKWSEQYRVELPLPSP
jgi:hypothetical protein